jgi:Sulfotransferase family
MHAPRPEPIFIVGCQRSGTTLVRLILDAHPNISCGPETRFLAALAQITGSEWHRMQRYGFPKEYWHEKVAEFFESIHRDYAERRGKTRWADKSPLYALSIDYLHELFPDCHVVHVIRDGRDVVASHRRGWGYLSAMNATKKWPAYVHTAREAGRRLPAGHYHELPY